jgi:hypothetical protein
LSGFVTTVRAGAESSGASSAIHRNVQVSTRTLAPQTHGVSPRVVARKTLAAPSPGPWLSLEAEGRYVAEAKDESRRWEHYVGRGGWFLQLLGV